MDNLKLPKDLLIKNYRLSSSCGLQRFFFRNELWLRVVTAVSYNVVGGPYWQQTEPEASLHWEALVQQIELAIQREASKVTPRINIEIFPEGWSFWSLGQPSLLCKHGVVHELNEAFTTGEFSELPSEF